VWATIEFEDSFEDGDYTSDPAWVTTNAVDWQVTPPPAEVAGAYSVNCTQLDASGVTTYSTDFTSVDLPWSYSFWWRFDQVGTWSQADPNKFWTFAYWYDSDISSATAEGVIMESDGRIGLDKNLGDGGVSGKTLFSEVLTTGDWHFIEIYTNSSSVYVYVNGSYVGDVSTMTKQTNGVLGVGCVYPAQSGTWNAFWDHVTLADELVGVPPIEGSTIRVDFFYHPGVAVLYLDGISIANASIRYYNYTDLPVNLALNTIPETEYIFSRYVLASRTYTHNPANLPVLASDPSAIELHSYVRFPTTPPIDDPDDPGVGIWDDILDFLASSHASVFWLMVLLMFGAIAYEVDNKIKG